VTTAPITTWTRFPAQGLLDFERLLLEGATYYVPEVPRPEDKLYPLWEAYPNRSDALRFRRPSEVSVEPVVGRVLHALVRFAQPARVYEVGTGFGVSGRYLLAALAQNGAGTFVTFEPNGPWADVAEAHLALAGHPFELVRAPVERAPARVFDVNLAFVDAIHEEAAVDAQLDLFLGRARRGAFLAVHDVFAVPHTWNRFAGDPRVRGALVCHGTLGILEVA
jgi:predicted O-methyltransferase YrrM